MFIALMHGKETGMFVHMSNPKQFKAAIALKCRQCVGPWNGKYEATPLELIEHCTKRTCGLFKFRPRLPKKEQSELERMLKDIL